MATLRKDRISAADHSNTGPTIDSITDAYAIRALRARSPPEACIDDSLGPYITSILRCSLLFASDKVTDLPEYDSLIELLMEHCTFDDESALRMLVDIAHAVKTGKFDAIFNEEVHNTKLTATETTLASEEKMKISFVDEKIDPTNIINKSLAIRKDAPQIPNPIQTLKYDKFVNILSLEKPDAMDYTKDKSEETRQEFLVPQNVFPPLTAYSNEKRKNYPPSKLLKDNGKKNTAISSHSRREIQGSFDINRYSNSSSHTIFKLHEERDPVIQMLLSMNPYLGEDAASEAYTLAEGDINIAQYTIEQAMSAPPVCRHMLANGCYRSDCHFSHNIEKHTCLFWIKGQCGKGKSCRFFHGFSERVLEGINHNTSFVEVPANNFSKNVRIATKNLSSHNLEVMSPSTLCPVVSSTSPCTLRKSNSEQPIANWVAKSVIGSPKVEKVAKNYSELSFASVASKGSKSSLEWSGKSAKDLSSIYRSKAKQNFIRIPQSLWNNHINRDSGAFYINDPIKRYMEVSKTCVNDNVIDLHFQSTKTFSNVLSEILPQKLCDHDEVWIVTGSGHHVNRRSHQKGGGALEFAVLDWLEEEGYNFYRGRDNCGHSGAVLVREI